MILRRRRAGLAVVLVVLVSAPVAGAAFQAVVDNAGNAATAGTLELTDNDGGAAPLVMTGAGIGDTDTGCTRLSYNGTATGRLRHFADLSGFLVSNGNLRLRVTRGTKADPAFRSCAGFTADSVDYQGLGNGVVFDGPLDRFAGSFEEGVLDPSGVTAGRYFTSVKGTAGLRSLYRLGETQGTGTAADAHGAANGTYEGAVYGQYTPAPANAENDAAVFRGGRVVVPRTIADDFSIELWMRYGQGSGSGDQWYEMAGLVDANVAGTAADFGLSLSATGRLWFGTGGSRNTSAKTRPGFNDGKWHHVVATRTRSSGALRVYVDGLLQAARDDADTASLTAAPRIVFGQLQSGGNAYDGLLDEVAIYDRALTDAEVRAHYRAPLDAEAWTAGESHDYKHELVVVDGDSGAYGNQQAGATLRWEARP